MKKIIITSFAIVAGVCAFSQSIERKLVASNGTTLVSGGFQLSYSLGEVAVLSASSGLSSPSFFASIGFQQPHVAKIGQVLPKENWVSAYPNPAINIVRLDIHGVNFQSSDIKVFNPIGQTVIAPFTFINGTIEINLSRLAAGAYIISITDKETGNNISSKIIKQHN